MAALEVTVKPNALMDSKEVRIKLTFGSTSFVFNLNGTAPLRPGTGDASESQVKFSAYDYNTISLNKVYKAISIPAEFEADAWESLLAVWKAGTEGMCEIYDKAASTAADWKNSCVIGSLQQVDITIGDKVAPIMNIGVNFPKIDETAA